MADATQIRAELMQRYLGVLPGSGEDDVLRLAVETGARAVGADEGSLLVFDPETDELVFVMTYGGSEDILIGQRFPITQGLTGLAATTGEVQIGAPKYKDVKQSETIGEIRSVIAAPMQLGDTLVGVMTAVSTRPDKRFTLADGQLYACLATVAALIVHQLERIRTLERGEGGGAEAAGLAADPAQREVMERVTRLLQRDPLVVRQIATMLGAIEAMAPAGTPR
jgi:transcriptional regulator with GAF, ATPase, and Fis domain